MAAFLVAASTTNDTLRDAWQAYYGSARADEDRSRLVVAAMMAESERTISLQSGWGIADNEVAIFDLGEGTLFWSERHSDGLIAVPGRPLVRVVRCDPEWSDQPLFGSWSELEADSRRMAALLATGDIERVERVFDVAQAFCWE